MATTYPYKLQKPSTANDRVRETADCYIYDSGIGDDTTNAEVLDGAAAFDADYVIAKDYLHDQDRTTESVREFRELYRGHECDATIMVPLQPPHADHYRDLPDASHYVLGGMAVDSVDTAQALEWIHSFREVAPEVYAHGLGIGGGIEIVEALAGKDILDSIDCATPEYAAMNGAVIDTRLRQKEIMAFRGGEGRCNRSYALAEFNSWQINDVWNNAAQSQHDLGAYL